MEVLLGWLDSGILACGFGWVVLDYGSSPQARGMGDNDGLGWVVLALASGWFWLCFVLAWLDRGILAYGFWWVVLDYGSSPQARGMGDNDGLGWVGLA